MPEAAVIRFAPEADPLAQAQRGDPEGFATIVGAHQGMVFSLANYFLRDRRLAEELSQDVFLELYRNLAQIESEAHLTFWLRRVTSHRCIDRHRQHVRRKEVAVDLLPEPSVMPAPRDCLLEGHLQRLVAELPEMARAIVILRYQEDLDPTDIAEMLGMRVNTVKSHLRRSLALLRSKFEQEEEARP